MLKVVAEMVIAPASKDGFMPLVSELVKASREDAGCVSYEFCQLTEGNSSYAMVETWEDQKTLDEHMQTEHFTKIVPEMAKFQTGDMKVSVYKVLI